MNDISLVIPIKNGQSFIANTLRSAEELLSLNLIKEIIVVDNFSKDLTKEIASKFSIKLLDCSVPGPSATRNLGWRYASGAYIWFVDADCELEENALRILVETILSSTAEAVSGGYLNANSNSILASTIQSEFDYRYQRMDGIVTYLTTCNLLCSRKLLEELDGFNERMLCVEDGDFIFRALKKNKKILFNSKSRLKHLHADKIFVYLKKQFQHGFWAADLYIRNYNMSFGHSYSGLIDHIQPVLLFLSLVLLPFGVLYSYLFLLAFLMAQLPIFMHIYRDISLQNALYFVILSFLRTIARLFGLGLGLISKFNFR